MPELILVTGASGFLGSHIVVQLLEKGYHVRGVARGAKADELSAAYASYGPAFSVVKITGLNDPFPDAFVGVSGLIHVATPMPGVAPIDEMVQQAIDGTLNAIIQAEKAGVKKVVVTSSIATVKNMAAGTGETDKDWNPMPAEYALASKQPMLVYAVSKTLSERALWEWAEKHPHVEVTTLNPTFFFGPFTPNFPIPAEPKNNNFSTNNILYNVLFRDGQYIPIATRYIDVRDVAAAHIAALSSPPTSQVGRKRMIISSPSAWSVKQLVAFVREKRPELKDRLMENIPEPAPDDVPAYVDWDRVKLVLGLSKEDFKPIETTMLETVDALLAVEKVWKEKGLEPARAAW